MLDHYGRRHLAAYGEPYRRARLRDSVDLEFLATRGSASEVREKIDLAFARPWDHKERVTLADVFLGWDKLETTPAVGSPEWRELAALARGGGA